MGELLLRDGDAVHGPPAFAGAPDAASLAFAHVPAAAPPMIQPTTWQAQYIASVPQRVTLTSYYILPLLSYGRPSCATH